MKMTHHCPSELPMNEACLIINNTADFPIKLLLQSTECEKCSLEQAREVDPDSTGNVTVNTWYKMQYAIKGGNCNYGCCNSTYAFKDYGHYTLNVEKRDEQTFSCELVSEEGPSIYWPILYAFAVYLGIALIWIIGKTLYRKGFFNKLTKKESIEISSEELNAAYSVSNTSLPQTATQQKKPRLRSLDTFRGLSITIMIFVNYGGGDYQFFHHSLWNGLTVADLVFPWFIWIMGVSMALSLRSLLRKSIPHCRIFRKIVKRSLILFALGIMLNTFTPEGIDLQQLRIPGVLQRFGISYFVVSTVHLLFAKPQDTYEHTRWAPFRDIFGYWVEWLFMLGLLTTHILLTFLLEVPGCDRGYLGPGGNHDFGKHYNCTGGAAGYIDRVVLGSSHLYQYPTFKKLYDGPFPYDPEGTLGCLTSIFLVFLGLQAGKILLTYKEWKPRIIRWLLWGLLTGAIAAALCKCSQNDGVIPINKNLWSVSFIMVNACFSFILLGAFYIICDVLGCWSGAPFYYAGMNSILLYVGHELTHHMFPWSWKVNETHWEHLAINLWGTSLWVIISIWLYYKKFFLAI